MNYKTKPTASVIKSFARDFKKKNPNENAVYEAAIQLTSGFFKNDDFKNIFVKVVFINGAFKTNIIDTSGFAKQLSKIKDFDVRLKKGDKNLINEIEKYKSPKTAKSRNNYSFATKFCHCHYPEIYSINDKYVRNSLFEFNKHFKFSSFTKKDLFDYNKFTNILSDFKEKLCGNDVDLATLDRFLWGLGKKNKK